MRDGLRLCLSLYACEPNRGSEPGVGWAWALGMAKRHETWAITRANNREAIESELDRLAVPAENRPRFVWVDLPRWFCRLKSAGIVPTSVYYLFWQFAARRAWDASGVRADIVHHVTFNSFAVPGVWWNRRERVVLGPLGGMSICPARFLACFPPLPRAKEFLRGLTRRFWRFDAFYLRSRRSADFVFYTTEAMRKRLGRSEASSVLLETAVPAALERRRPRSAGTRRERRFVWAGTLAGHKAGDIAVRAFAKAFRDDPDPPVLEMFGTGKARAGLERLVARLGAKSFVRLRGVVSQKELWDSIESATALVFTSVRDTSGNVVLEALALGTPVICFKHQGVASIVDEMCALTVTPRSYGEAVADFATAMKRLANEPELADTLGMSGRRLVLERFSWDGKFDAADAIYRSVTSNSSVRQTFDDGGAVDRKQSCSRFSFRKKSFKVAEQTGLSFGQRI